MEPARMVEDSFGRLHQVRAAMAAQRQTFERMSESGLCRVFVDLEGGLLDVVFLRNDVFGLDEPEAVAREVLSTIKLARADADKAAARLVERVFVEREGQGT